MGGSMPAGWPTVGRADASRSADRWAGRCQRLGQCINQQIGEYQFINTFSLHNGNIAQRIVFSQFSCSSTHRLHHVGDSCFQYFTFPHFIFAQGNSCKLDVKPNRSTCTLLPKIVSRKAECHS
jgi:hypothetical protein